MSFKGCTSTQTKHKCYVLETWIEAPREVKILRTELAARIAREGPALSKRA